MAADYCWRLVAAAAVLAVVLHTDRGGSGLVNPGAAPQLEWSCTELNRAERHLWFG